MLRGTSGIRAATEMELRKKHHCSAFYSEPRWVLREDCCAGSQST